MSDLISRQDAKRIVSGDGKYFGRVGRNVLHEMWTDICSLPSADLKKMVGCTGCEHYDQQQTAMICRECRRYYKDMYEEW